MLEILEITVHKKLFVRGPKLPKINHINKDLLLKQNGIKQIARGTERGNL